VLGYLREDQLATLLLPIGAMNKSDVRRHAERLGLRTWDKPDSQDVCFIEASKGREVFLRQRIDLTPATIVDAASGEEIGATNGAELMTVGQRRGVLPARDGERRFVAKVDLEARRVEVGRLEDILIDEIALDEASTDVLARRSRLTAQRYWPSGARTAYRRARRCGEGRRGDSNWTRPRDPSRPVSP
jgi:tRNA-specific 2-thiouridylase